MGPQNKSFLGGGEGEGGEVDKSGANTPLHLIRMREIWHYFSHYQSP